MLRFPLKDITLNMDVYKIHNLPSLHSATNTEFIYRLEGNHLAVTNDGEFAALPSDQEIQLCVTTSGHLCSLNTALYPTRELTWCVYNLFINNQEGIDNNCPVVTSRHYTPKVISLGGYIWAIATTNQKKEAVNINCRQEENTALVQAPLTILTIPDGCYAYSSEFKIPAKNDLTMINDLYHLRERFLSQFNAVYHKHDFNEKLWKSLGLTDLSQDELKEVSLSLARLPPMAPKYLNKELKRVKPMYRLPAWLRNNWRTFTIVVVFACVFAALILFLACWAHKKHTSMGLLLRGLPNAALATKQKTTKIQITDPAPPGSPPSKETLSQSVAFHNDKQNPQVVFLPPEKVTSPKLKPKERPPPPPPQTHSPNIPQAPKAKARPALVRQPSWTSQKGTTQTPVCMKMHLRK